MKTMSDPKGRGRPRANPTRPPDGYFIRLSPELRERLDARAEADRRSVKDTIIVALERFLRTSPTDK